MDLGLQNKNIIVTGGTRGIGLAAAAACAARVPTYPSAVAPSKVSMRRSRIYKNTAHKFMGQFAISPTRNRLRPMSRRPRMSWGY